MECVIFNCNNSPAGFIFYRVFQGFSYCEYIGITRKCRGMNFASSLLRYVAGDGRQWILEIEVNSEYDTNSPQVRLFSNNGFSEVPFHYEMPRTDEIYPGAKFRMWSKHTLSQQEFNEIYTTLKEDEYF